MKKMRIVSLILIFAFAISGCSVKEEQKEEKKEEVEANQKTEEKVEEMETIIYFHGDDNVEDFIEEKEERKKSPKGMGAQSLIDLLAEKKVLPEQIKVNSFSKEGSILKLDLSIEFEQYVQTMGTAGETITIGCLVNTFLVNYEAEGMELKIEGRDLETGHNIYDYVLEKYEGSTK